MSEQKKSLAITERSLIVIFLVLVIFLSPVSDIWAALDAPWYSPYLAWAVAIFLSWLLQHHLKNSSDNQ